MVLNRGYDLCAAREKFKEPEQDFFTSPVTNLQSFGYLQKTDDTEAGGRFIRDFGLPGQQPSASGTAPEGLHGPIAFRNRVYIAYGTGAKGVLQIVDRDKLLKGSPQAADPFAPTVENLLYPQVGRLDMSPDWGGHTSFPVLGLPVPGWAKNHSKTVSVLSTPSGRIRFELMLSW